MGYFYRWEDFPQKEVSYLKGLPEASLLKIRIMSTERIMMTDIKAQKGARVGVHHHVAEQILFIFKGKFKATVGGETRILGPGDIQVCPSNCPHGGEWIEDGEAMEAVSPIRMDNFTGYVISHTFFEEGHK